MGRPAPKERLEHILTAITRIKEFVANVNEELFLADIQLQSAVQYQFLIIGEAIRSIDRDILEKYPYPWHVPCSFRNYIIHEYHGIKMVRIYYATQDLDDLQHQIAAILETEV